MKKIILATLLAGLGSTATLAADLGARAPYAKGPAMMAPVASWAGFYVGGNIGYGWGSGSTDSTASSAGTFPGIVAILRGENGSFNSGSKGVIGGGQLGYNWQIGSLVTGLEADI